MDKKCSRCGETKPVGEYYKNGNRLRSSCRSCEQIKDRERYYKDLEKNREKRRIAAVRFRQTDYGKKAKHEYQKKYHTLKMGVAHISVYRYLTRPNNCEVCGVGCKPHGHHHDYNKRTDVIWCCPACHSQIHVGQKTIQISEVSYG